MKHEVYTVGYEGRSFEELAEMLMGSGVKQVFDVRRNPVSVRREFSRDNLKRSLSRYGIWYMPFSDLGPPYYMRKRYKSGIISFREFSEVYFEHLIANAGILHCLEELAALRRSVLMCFERDWRGCHRSIIARQMACERGFEVVNL